MKQWVDRVLAVLAFGALVIFLAVPMLKLGEIDFTIVIIAVLLLAGVDFALSIFTRRNGNGRN